MTILLIFVFIIVIQLIHPCLIVFLFLFLLGIGFLSSLEFEILNQGSVLYLMGFILRIQNH